MKYYDKQPIAGYIILPPVGAVFSWIVLYLLASIFVDDISDPIKFGSLLVLYLFFLGWYIYANRFRDYIELSPGQIIFFYDTRRNKPSITITTNDILLFEIISTHDGIGDEFYRVYTTDTDLQDFERFMQFSSYEVPLNDLIEYLTKNNTPFVRKRLKDTDIETIKLKKSRLIIQYYSKWIPKRIRIPISYIENIELVQAHPVSMTDDYYLVRTRSGADYQFSHYLSDEEDIKKYCIRNGIPFIDMVKNRIKAKHW